MVHMLARMGHQWHAMLAIVYTLFHLVLYSRKGYQREPLVRFTLC